MSIVYCMFLRIFPGIYPPPGHHWEGTWCPCIEPVVLNCLHNVPNGRVVPLIELTLEATLHTSTVTLHDGAGFGLASHLGVLADIPSVGVGKKLYHVDGLKKGPEHKQKVF